MGKKLAWLSVGSGIGTLALMGLTLYRAANSWMLLHRDASRIIPYIMVLCGILIINMGGIAIGAIAASRRDGSRRWGLLGVATNIFQSVVFLVFLGIWGFSVMTMYSHIPRQTHFAKKSTPDPEATAPIVISPTSKNWKEVHAIFLVQLNRLMLTGYEQAGTHDDQWDEQARTLISMTMTQIGGEADRPESELASLDAQILAKGCNDPLVYYCCARSQKEIPDQKNFYGKAVEGFKNSHYPRLLAAWTASRLGRTLNPASEAPALEEADQAFLSFLKEAMEDGSITDAEWGFLVDDLKDLPVFKRKGREICGIVENSTAEKWVSQTLWGLYYTNEAWKARGDGYANTVSNAGWKGFNDNLEKASVQLTAAWESRKDQPQAAEAMISVAMGLGRNDTRREMRLWFDRATAAMFDDWAAYNSLVWGFRPRWFGSHEDMLAIGEQCLNTGRFDTNVPGIYFKTVKDVASELNDHDEIFKDLGVQQNLEKMFEGYIADPAQAKWQSCNRTHLILFYMKIGKIKEAKSMLEANGNQLDARAAFEWKADPRLTVEKLRAISIR